MTNDEVVFTSACQAGNPPKFLCRLGNHNRGLRRDGGEKKPRISPYDNERMEKTTQPRTERASVYDNVCMSLTSRLASPSTVQISGARPSAIADVKGTAVDATTAPSATPLPAASFDRSPSSPHLARTQPDALPASSASATGASPLETRLQSMTRSPRPSSPSGVVERLAREMTENWPGYGFMGLLAAAPGLAIGAPVIAAAGALVGPVVMGMKMVGDHE